VERTRRRSPEARPRSAARRSDARLARGPELPAAASRGARASRATDDVRRSVHHLRDANFDNISLDSSTDSGQSTSDLGAISTPRSRWSRSTCLLRAGGEAGTRFTHAHGDELARQADAMEGYFELVVERLTAAGYRWYETANFCRTDADGRDLRAQHNLAYWPAATTSGSASGGFDNRDRALAHDAQAAGLPRRAAPGRAPAARAGAARPEVRARERVLLDCASTSRSARRARRRPRPERSPADGTLGSPSGTAAPPGD